MAPARVVVKLTNDQLALCDTQTDGGGWIVIQRRIKGDVNFTRDWNDYKTGFGSLSGDLWMGNDVISDLTSKGYTELRIDMTYKAQSYYAAYTQFLVQPETADYQMTFMTYTGNASDDLSFHNGMRFTTFDRDNDWGHPQLRMRVRLRLVVPRLSSGERQRRLGEPEVQAGCRLARCVGGITTPWILWR
ncbi:fibrinogen-like protein A [Physella acuta]|uniref:fibrinogen-like protein A n=1 Tax=Physella acuta TaxID=109671 RepID=UPI0027DCE59D|nr:fibrinogen-like protein A [Physella acuta]